MARIELYKVFAAFRKTNELMEKAERNLNMVHDVALENEGYDTRGIIVARGKIDYAIGELRLVIGQLQKAKQILTKDK